MPLPLQWGLSCAGACRANRPVRPCCLLPLPSRQVAAYNDNGDLGARTASSAPFLLGTLPPSAPQLVVAASLSPQAAIVGFQSPTTDGGSPVSRWVLRRGRGEGAGAAVLLAPTAAEPPAASLQDLAAQNARPTDPCCACSAPAPLQPPPLPLPPAATRLSCSWRARARE